MAVGDRTVAVRLLAETSGYISGMNQAALAAWRVERQTQNVGRTTSKELDGAGKSAGRFGNVLLGLGGIAIVGGLAKTVGMLMDFDDAMARVSAATMGTEEELDALRQTALDLGRDTVFSAAEAADGITELAKAGVSTADIMGGALKGSLDLAAAGEMSVAEAAETAATAMVQFNLAGSDVEHIADLLAAGAGKAQGSVHDLGMAMQQGGQVASMLGWSLEETVGFLSMFAAAGLTGSDAGTSFKTMLLRLAGPTAKAAGELQRLGIDMYDANGNMLTGSALAAELQTAFQGMDPAARNAALAIIFGTDAVRGATVALQSGAAGADEWIAKVDDAGYAAEVADRRMDTLRGDIEKLGGTFETIVNGSGAGLVQLFRGIVQGADDALSALDAWDRGANDVMQNALDDPTFGVDQLELSTDMNAFEVYDATLGRLGRNIGSALEGAFAGMGGGLSSVMYTPEWLANLEAGKTAMVEAGDVTLGLGRGALEAAGAFDLFGQKSARAASAAEAAADPMGSMAEAMDLAQEYGIPLAEALTAVGVEADEAADMVEDLGDALEASGLIFRDTQEAQDNLTSAINDAQKPFEDLQKAQDELAEANLEYAEASTEAEKAAAAEKVEKAELAVQSARTALTIDGETDSALENRDALRDLAASALASARTQVELEGDVEGAKDEILRARQATVDAMIAMGYSRAEANRYADQLGLIPGNVNTYINAYGLANAVALASTLRSQLTSLNGYVARVGVTVATNTANRLAVMDSRLRKDGGWAFADGGMAGYPSGGWVRGPGSMRSDSIPAWLSRGEYVVNAMAAASWAPLLEAINSGRMGGGFTVNMGGVQANQPQQAAQAVVHALRAQSYLMGV